MKYEKLMKSREIVLESMNAPCWMYHLMNHSCIGGMPVKAMFKVFIRQAITHVGNVIHFITTRN